MSGRTEVIDQIRALLDELETNAADDGIPARARNFDALELPELVAAIIDHLHPQLTPYEVAIYWYLFRTSILASGEQYVRASVRGLMHGVVTSASGKSTSLAQSTVRNTLQELEEKGAVVKAGDTTREGTLYKVSLPEEIASCRERMKVASIARTEEIDVQTELDYYNIPENRLKVFERDEYLCRYCGKQLTRFTATLDHIQPVSRRGDNSFDNLTTACLHCNSRRGNRPVMDVLPKPDVAE